MVQSISLQYLFHSGDVQEMCKNIVHKISIYLGMPIQSFPIFAASTNEDESINVSDMPQFELPWWVMSWDDSHEFW